MIRASFLALMIGASFAHAGGMDDTATTSSPCAPIPTAGMTDEMLRGWRAMLEMKADECGPPPVLLPQFTDRQKLEWAFNGSRIPSPVTPVPVPASALMLVAALAMLALKRRT